ncbi:Protein brunelleschi [Gryllus bimaculatus]|nr:Protein brunelleschi [Gryllus bimaculatus]
MPSQSLQGRVSLKGLSLTPDMLDVVRMSPLQWDVTVDGQPVKPQPQEELSAVAGQLLTLGVNLAEQGTAYHECSVVFFTPGQYKADIQCTTQLEGEDGDGSHVWKFTPAVCISVLDAHPN